MRRDLDGERFTPAFWWVDGVDAAEAVLGRRVIDTCPEPRVDERDPRWFAVTVVIGVGTDDDGEPMVGDEADVERVGRGRGTLLVTDRRLAGLLTELEADDATVSPDHDGSADDAEPHFGSAREGAVGRWLAFALERSDIVSVEGESRRRLGRTSTRALTIEAEGESWGAMGIVVHGEFERSAGMLEAPLHKTDALPLLELLPHESA
jgi:hypothetical protein